MTINSVIAHIGPNQISEGFYTLEDGLLTMVGPEGGSIGLEERLVQHRLRPGDNEEAIAKMLTKKIRSHLRGETVEGFSRYIDYPAGGVA